MKSAKGGPTNEGYHVSSSAPDARNLSEKAAVSNVTTERLTCLADLPSLCVTEPLRRGGVTHEHLGRTARVNHGAGGKHPRGKENWKMRSPGKTEAIAKAIKSLLHEKRAVEDREKGLVRALNEVLTKIGYQVVQGSSRRGPGRRRGRRPGRKPGRPPVKRGRPAGKTVRRRRRGRPRKSR